MSTDTPRPIHAARIISLAIAVTLTAAAATAQTRHSGRRVMPDGVWVVDRTMPDLVVWQSLVQLTSSDAFTPIVLHGGDRQSSTASLNHLIRIATRGSVAWVSDRGTPIGLDTDLRLGPVAAVGLESDGGPVVYSADPSLDAIAALIAMRVDGVLTSQPPEPGTPAILVGVEPSLGWHTANLVLQSRSDALAEANRLASGSAVLVVREHQILPEHVLWAYQRDAKILEVRVPDDYAVDDPDAETRAVASVDGQITAVLPSLVVGGRPEALVIAGDWYQIPFRFDRGNPAACTGCDNGIYEYAADVEYANLDNDPWGEPDVPVGRLMSPDRDLLALQCVVGIWREFGAFRDATDGVVVDLLGNRDGIRDAVIDRWQSVLPHQVWNAMGPDQSDINFHLDRDEFFALADRSDIVVIHGHGHPEYLSPRGMGGAYNQALSGKALLETPVTGQPSFWFIHACATGRPDGGPASDPTLLVGLQSRLAYGALLAVENIGAGSGDPWWWTSAAEPGVPVGELVRRFHAASIAVYRDGGQAGLGMPKALGVPEKDCWNAYSVLSWIGDPLTPVTVAD